MKRVPNVARFGGRCVVDGGLPGFVKSGGLLAITIQPKDTWEHHVDPDIMTLYSGSDIASMFSEAGYENIRVQVPPPGDKTSLEFILGMKWYPHP
jgi:hypothetical protein